MMGGDRVPNQFSGAVDENERRRRELTRRHLEGEENADKLDLALQRARSSWLEEFLRLDDIAVDVFNGKRGGFLRKFADAWLHADPQNKRIIKPAWAALIRKYNLEEDPKGTGPSGSRRTP